jgi:hypothetical protein
MTWMTPGTEAKSGTIKRNSLLQTVNATKIFEATPKRRCKVYQELVLLLVVRRTHKEGLAKLSDCFVNIFRVICFPGPDMIDVSKVIENPHSVGVFLVQEVKQFFI